MRISASEAFALMREQGYTYLDVRTPAEFELGHPTGAVNIPWQLAVGPDAPPNPDFLASVQRAFEPSAKLIVGCHTARRSTLAAAALETAGFGDVRVQAGGWAGVRDAFGGVVEPGWDASGLPRQ